MTHNSWSVSRGVDTAAQNLIGGPDDSPEDMHKIFNPIASGKQHGRPANPIIYVAPATINGAEHPRWINRNWEVIFNDLARLVLSSDPSTYQIDLPHESKAKDFPFLTWFIFDEWEELCGRTDEKDCKPQLICDDQQCVYNQPYSRSSGDEKFVLVHKPTLDSMLHEKRQRFNQEELLMNMKEMMLVLWPLAGEKGWDAYKEVAAEYESSPAALGERVEYSCQIAITYEAYKHSMLHVPQQPVDGEASGSSSSGGSFTSSRLSQLTDSTSSRLKALGQ